MTILIPIPDWVTELDREIVGSSGATSQPIHQWGISSEQFERLERFQKDIVLGGWQIYWTQDTIELVYARLFLCWAAEDLRRNRSLDFDVTSGLKRMCGFDLPAIGEVWRNWVSRSEYAWDREPIYVGGSQSRSYRGRILREAGILRRLFDGYHRGGKDAEGKVKSYWTSLLELWLRLDSSPSQLLAWAEGSDWYGRTPDGKSDSGRGGNPRPGGEGFYQQFYEHSLALLQLVQSLISGSQKLSVEKKIEGIEAQLGSILEPSEGLRNFLKDIIGESSGQAKGGRSAWEPIVDRVFYMGTGQGMWTRITPVEVLPSSCMSEIGALGGDRVELEIHGSIVSQSVASYFSQSGRRYQGQAESFLPPADSVRATLTGTNSGWSAMIVDPLEEGQPWFFEPLDQSSGVWKLMTSFTARFPMVVSVPTGEYLHATEKLVGNEFHQDGLQPRTCFRFDSMDELLQSNIEIPSPDAKSLRIALSQPLQEIQGNWRWRATPICLGLPQSLTRGVGEQVEFATDTRVGYGQCPERLPVAGYFRVTKSASHGVGQRLVVLPKGFRYRCSMMDASSAKVVFEGVSQEDSPVGVGCDPDGIWRNLKYGDRLRYQWGNFSIEIPAPLPGIAWEDKDGRGIRDTDLSMDTETWLDLDVARNPLAVRVDFALRDSEGHELSSIAIKSDFFTLANDGTSRIRRRMNLGSMGSGVLRKLFAMTNDLDAKVIVGGELGGGGSLPEPLPRLNISRFREADSDIGEMAPRSRFWISPLHPHCVCEENAPSKSDDIWIEVPGVVVNGKFVWDQKHRPFLRRDLIGEILPDSGIAGILSDISQKMAMTNLNATFDSGLSEADWRHIESTFRLMMERRVPAASMRLVQAVLGHDKILCELLSRDVSGNLFHWMQQSATDRYCSLGFDLRLIRKSVVEGAGPRMKMTIWSELHRMNSGVRLEDLDPSTPVSGWPGNPEMILKDGEEDLKSGLKTRWDDLYTHGPLGNNGTLEEARFWNAKRIPILKRLTFSVKEERETFPFDTNFTDWIGFDQAWPKGSDPDPWIKATLWLGWFSVCASDEQYQLHHGDALRFLKQLECVDPLWTRHAFSIAQARAMAEQPS